MRSLFKKACNIVLILFAINISLSKAQSDYLPPDGLNNWYLELAGSSLFWSMNYEKYLYRDGTENYTWLGRVGAGFNPIDYNIINSLYLERRTFIFPFTTTALIGKNKEKLELGGGFTMLTKNFTESEIVPNINLGLRVMESNRVCFRVTYVPLFRQANTIHWIGVSIGKNFNFK